MSNKLELTVFADVNGTRFQAVYEVKGEKVELTSADFGDGATALNGVDPHVVAERLLREIVEQGSKTSVGVIMRDDGTS